MPPSPPVESRSPSNDGRHLSSIGPYQDLISSMCIRNPNLRYPDRKLIAGRGSEFGHVVVLEFHDKQVERKDFRASGHLQSHLEENNHLQGRRRLYLLEDLSPNFVAVFGSHFTIDPALFMRQQRNTLWEHGHTSGNLPDLPSLNDPSKSFYIRYPELRYFGWNHIEDFYMKCATTGRHIGLTRDRGRFDNVGNVHRSTSFWSQRSSHGGWDGRWP
jgi:hypothetical protein